MKKSVKEPSPNQASMLTQLLIPLAALIRGDLLALVHQLGLQAIVAMLENERTKLCGERYKHDTARAATRGGSTHGDLALGGRRVTLRRPRVVDRKGREVPLDTWEQLAGEDALDVRALEQMAIGVATRKYARSLETLPDDVTGTYPPDRAPCPRVSPLDARVQPVVGAAYVAARSRAHAAFHAAGMSGGRSRAMTIPRESRGKM